MFSLLRGSGLKFRMLDITAPGIGSPSYEGVDWNRDVKPVYTGTRGSPSYEGVDWNDYKGVVYGTLERFSLLRGSGLKWECAGLKRALNRSPSYEGVDWNTQAMSSHTTAKVLPLTREWIEIRFSEIPAPSAESSPSYEGVDWNEVRPFRNCP